MAQDAREVLGPGEAADAEWTGGPHPLEMLDVNAELRPDLRGVHPRVFVTAEGIEELRARARTTHREIWSRVLSDLYALRNEPPEPPAQERRIQNRVGIAIAEAALAYVIEEDPIYLEAARKYMDAAVSYDVWGYIYNKPNVDLAAGHLLYGLGWGYDLLYEHLSVSEREKYRTKLAGHARLLYDHYRIRPGRTYSYSQNHVSIPMAGLAVAAYALYDEVEDAPEWALLARRIFDRVLDTYSHDGYYYEGFEYWVFATPWLIHYLDAHQHATGESLWNRSNGLRRMHRYVAHTMLPGGRDVFDFGDTFEGALTRLREGDDHRRTHPDGRLHSNYNLLYRLAGIYQDSEIQGVAAWLRGLDQVNMEEFWTLLWRDPGVGTSAMEEMPPYEYFTDHDVVFWRSAWSAGATAIAFKAGPPEGHRAAHLLRRFPDWHLSTGHAHPDANGFIIYAGGTYLTGDAGWTGLPMTAHHNTIVFDDMGQAREGEGHDVFHGVPYERLDRIHIASTHLSDAGFLVEGDATHAYEQEVGVERFVRRFRYRDGVAVVEDDVSLSTPRHVTRFIHADENLTCAGPRCVISRDDAKLLITADGDVTLDVEPNVVTAPGDPGSVDKGESQARGLRARISTRRPMVETVLKMTLEIERP